MKTAIFPDGVAVRAESWHRLEEALRSDPWNPSALGAYREEMAARTKVWTGERIDEGDDVSSETFLRSLEAAGMIRLEEEE